MTNPIESPEAFAARCFCEEGYPAREVEHCSLGHIIIRNIRARDAAVRREALREAADLLESAAARASAYGDRHALLLDASRAILALATGDADD